MSDTGGSSRARVFAQARPLLPWLALAVALLAVWLAWSGWRGLQEESRRNSASLARDTAASVAASSLGGERNGRAAAAGLDVTLEVAAEMPHVYQSFLGLLPEAEEALEQIGQWLRR